MAGKGEDGPRGGPAGDLYVVTHVDPSPVFKRKGDNLEVEVPLTIPEALLGAEVHVPTLDGAKTLRVSPVPSTVRCSGCAARGPPSLVARAAATFTTASCLTYPSSSSDEQRAAVDELSKVMNGNPRAKLFTEASS